MNGVNAPLYPTSPAMLWLCRILLLFIVSMAFTACKREELIMDGGPGNTRVEVQLEWSAAALSPKGVGLYFYPVDGSAPIHILSNSVTNVRLSVPEGRYHVLAINGSTSDFSFLDFENMGSIKTATAWLKKISAPDYPKEQDEILIANPDMLAADTLMNVVVAGAAKSCHCDTEEQQMTIFRMSPKRLVQTVEIRAYMIGINNLKSASAAITGLASNINVGTGINGTERGTQLFYFDGIEYLNTEKTVGYITATVTSLGKSNAMSRAASDQVLKLTVRLADNSVHNFSVPIGDKFIVDQNNNLHVILLIGTGERPEDPPIELPNVRPIIPGGFEPDIKDWGTPVVIEIDI